MMSWPTICASRPRSALIRGPWSWSGSTPTSSFIDELPRYLSWAARRSPVRPDRYGTCDQCRWHDLGGTVGADSYGAEWSCAPARTLGARSRGPNRQFDLEHLYGSRTPCLGR